MGDGQRALSVDAVDPAARALAFALQVLGVPADPLAILHQSGKAALDEADLLRAARRFPVKVGAHRSSFKRLQVTPLPVLARLKDGRWLVIGRVSEEKLLIQDPTQPKPAVLDRDEFLKLWSGRLILLARRAGLIDPSRKFGIGWFLGAVAKYAAVMSEVLVASFFLQVFALLAPLFFQVVIDKVLVHRGLSTLDVLMAGLALIAIFEVLLGGIRTYIFAHTTNRIDVELGARLFRHLFALPIAYFQSRRVGDSVARVRELENIRQFITGSALTLVIDLLFTTVFLAVMFYYSSTLTWIVIGAFPFYVALSLVVVPLFRRRLDEKFRRGAENQAFLVEAVTGVETVKAMAIEPQMQRRWEEQLAAYVRSSFSTLTLANVATQTATLFNKIVLVLTLFFGARLVITGDLTVGELVAFNMLAANVNAPVLRLAQLWQDFQQARVSIDRLGDILNSQPEPAVAGATALPPIRGDIEFDHVSFRYRIDSQPVLSDISLSIKAGQVVGIVGPSGSGKSTLTKLVQRLYVPESGRVSLDGIDLSLVDAAWLRRQIGIVLQESTLFNRTVRENIAIANPAMPIERVIQAAELAGAHEFIAQLPRGYDTEIGERGTSLSGGQRQRIAIARALIGNPRILILDEATSALDYESESIIQANMRRISSGRTVLIIAHRLSTVRGADRIITIHQGRLVEDGTHEELMRNGGRYANLHRLQSATS
ncbi:MAG TPA: type I secretion system permease/ATPase [Streptosporangiaceae bacterium]|nr:type I secretion system permease/ATPase [Streptosporangiaceae bacterium]